MAYLTREQILTADDLPREPVAVPEWFGTVVVRALNGLERNAMVERFVAAQAADAEEPFWVHLAAAAMCDEQGQAMFPDLADVRALQQRNGIALERVLKVARRLNGMNLAEAKKNLT